jgi:surfeit locus 1 family protein
MSSVESYDTSSVSLRERLRPWRALPRLLVSRQWRWLTLGAILLALGLIRLGVWQLDRLEQRRAHNALIKARIDAPPIALTDQPLDLDAYEYQRVTVSGQYDSANEIVLRNRTLNGVPGMDIVTPLQLAGSDQRVLVNRGWVPLEQAEQAARQQFAVSGPATIQAIVRRPQMRSGWISPQDPQPPGGRLDAWFRVDVTRIANQLPYPLLPLYVEQLPDANHSDLPQPHPDIDYTSEGSHLSYAIQWFSFATIGLCGYAAFVVTRSQPEPHNQP